MPGWRRIFFFWPHFCGHVVYDHCHERPAAHAHLKMEVCLVCCVCLVPHRYCISHLVPITMLGPQDVNLSNVIKVKSPVSAIRQTLIEYARGFIP